MVKVIGSSKRAVNVEVQGVGETIRMLRAKGKSIKDALELEVLRNANFLQQEVQESIIGNRAEPKSVDSGKLGNSISVDKIGEYSFKIFPRKQTYNGGTTTSEVAKFMEFGTTRIRPRRHFRNSLNRNRKKIVDNIDKAVQKSI